MLSAPGRNALVERLSASTGQLSRVAGVALFVAGIVRTYYYLVVFDGLTHLIG